METEGTAKVTEMEQVSSMLKMKVAPVDADTIVSKVAKDTVAIIPHDADDRATPSSHGDIDITIAIHICGDCFMGTSRSRIADTRGKGAITIAKHHTDIVRNLIGSKQVKFAIPIEVGCKN